MSFAGSVDAPLCLLTTITSRRFARSAPKGMRIIMSSGQKTFVGLWNPKHWPPPEDADAYYAKLKREEKLTKSGKRVTSSWSFGTRTPESDVMAGDRVFMLQVGRVKSVVASGELSSGVWIDTHWSEGGDAPYVGIRWDRVLSPEVGLPRSQLLEACPEYHWHIMSSGVELPENAAKKLEDLWAKHQPDSLPKITGKITEVPFKLEKSNRGDGPSPRQGPEHVLAERYFNYLKRRGHEVVTHRYSETGIPPLFNDLFDKTENVLVEAKAGARRTDVRTAVGQLMDYHRFYTRRAQPRKRVLLSARPDESTLRYLQALQIECAFPVGRSFELYST